MKLFMFPFSGGSFYAYRAYFQYLPAWLEMIPVEYPGHGRRMGEPLLTDMNEIVDDIYDAVKNELGTPYAFYGHSMGASVGYLLARKIRDENRASPVHLFMSGRRGPSCESDKQSHTLPDDLFLQKVCSYGGIPDEILNEKELLDLFLPIMKADFKAIETYRYHPAEPLSVPMTVMIGESDTEVSKENALNWQKETSSPIVIETFDGGHFFIFQNTEKIMKIIVETLQQYRHLME